MTTTHLVIADVSTLSRLLSATDRLVVIHDRTVPLGGWLPWQHVETGDTWMFRTPESAAVDKADYWYVQGQPAGRGYVLPLIAACDLLGVDEL